MDLLHKLAAALQTAIIDISACKISISNDIPLAECLDRVQKADTKKWEQLLQQVRDLDSALFNPEKCKAASCIGDSHICDQDATCKVIARIAAQEIFGSQNIPNEKLSMLEQARVEACEAIERAIARAVGELQIGEDRKVVLERLDTIRAAFNHHEALPLAIARYTFDDLKWLHAVAVRGLKLYAVELSRGWCHVHGKQNQFCADCANKQHSTTLRYIAEVVKKVCPPEMITRLVGLAHFEPEFCLLLSKADSGSGPDKEPLTGVGL